MYRFGNKLKISIDGESHSAEMKVTLSGLPEGFEIDEKKLLAFMQRRKSGAVGTTARTENDVPQIISGITDGKTDGRDFTAIIKNENIKPSDYSEIADIPRPGHADYTSYVKYGRIFPGGGRFSGRMTAPLCIAGGAALQILEKSGVEIAAHAQSVAGICDKSFNPCCQSLSDETAAMRENGVPVTDAAAAQKMTDAIKEAAEKGDSVGGIIECAVCGYPAGAGGELFEGIESRISAAMFAIPAVKGVEFGAGFAAADSFGSENNDAFVTDGERIYTKTNNCGGILGGISNGMPIIFRAAVKPVPSISLPQESVSLSKKENVILRINGRHDSCAVMRAVPAVEAAAGLVLLDLLL